MNAVEYAISHDWSGATREDKARWFQSLSVEERIDIFLALTEIALARDPSLANKPLPEKNDWNQGRILVLQLPDQPPDPPLPDGIQHFTDLF